MSSQECREKVLAKLTTARYDLEDALNLTTQVARYDSAVLPELTLIKLALMIADLSGVLHQLEGSQ
jgi:hypothetical protein